MYTLVCRPGRECDVYLNYTFIGVWRGLVFYPDPSYKDGIPITLMRFLLTGKETL